MVGDVGLVKSEAAKQLRSHCRLGAESQPVPNHSLLYTRQVQRGQELVDVSPVNGREQQLSRRCGSHTAPPSLLNALPICAEPAGLAEGPQQ
jgi:hypothetical protein